MRAFIFFSVYERLFDPVARELRDRYGVTELSGFCWGRDQESYLAGTGTSYSPLVVFSRDVIQQVNDRPDLAYLESCEKRYGCSIHRLGAGTAALRKV